MTTVKSMFSKILIASMVFAMISTTLVLSPAAAYELKPVIIEEGEEVPTSPIVTDGPKELPPREAQKDPFWSSVYWMLVGFVGASLANTVTSNMINNGIDYACKKWSGTWGVKHTCAWIQD
ncbi:hypothetical protein J7E71_13000 [Mesobacillus foraminis]|uniref:hypothetical protein n=1 Tax=Mesobacillus foraminis TaxID=279826 RepID=UPI001BE4F334|nr:hypothetical protein [Mesobacillus foraminis]MBT2756865.1 hypothetical protein [Mesobacillus foraminis]